MKRMDTVIGGILFFSSGNLQRILNLLVFFSVYMRFHKNICITSKREKIPRALYLYMSTMQ